MRVISALKHVLGLSDQVNEVQQIFHSVSELLSVFSKEMLKDIILS